MRPAPTSPRSEIRHAGLIARRLCGHWSGVLVEGPSGAGKSDLGLRAIAAGFRLVADDRTVIFASADRLYGCAPRPLAGLLEARGVGILHMAHLPVAEIILWLSLTERPDGIERLPDLALRSLMGVKVPHLSCYAQEPSATAKLDMALRHLGGRLRKA